MGESLATVEQHSTPLAEATTPSLEALKAFSSGVKLVLSSGNAAGIPSLRRAVEIDPLIRDGARPAGAVVQHSWRVSPVRREHDESLAVAESRAAIRERFFIDFTYDRQVTGNLEKAYQTLELWLQTYPRSGQALNPQGLLGGISTHGTGRFERVIEVAQRRIVADPDSIFGYSNLATANYYLDRFAEAEAAIRRAAERKLDGVAELLVIAYNLALLKSDVQQVDRVAGLAKGNPRAEPAVAHLEALALARSGRLEAARRSSNRAIDVARRQGERDETVASFQAARAVWEAVCGNGAEGRRDAMAALERSQGRDLQYAAGLALALAGDTARSQRLADDLEKRFPEDTFAKFTYVPVLRAIAALQRGDPAGGVEQLQAALPYELAVNGLNFSQPFLGGLHSAYVRGQALMAARRYTEAAVEFQKILNHRGLVGMDPIGALAYLQLGRVHVLSNDTAKAKAAYQDFLTLWKDADSDLPLLRQAKAEYARLP